MSEAREESDTGQSGGSEEPKKPMSPLEKIRAAAAAKKAAEGLSAEPGPAAEAKHEAPAGAAAESKPLNKLAAIRAAAAAKAAAGKAAPEPAAAKPKAETPAAAAAQVKTKPTKPAAPKKPERPKEAEAAAPSRRSFITTLLSWVGIAWVAFTGGCVAALGATVRFLYPNVSQEPPSVFKIDPPDKFEKGVVDEQWKNEYGVWVVRAEWEGKDTLYAIRTVCTHLGCTPNWLEGEQKFKCPCHGSGFRKTGINFEGPAPRPLERYQIALADDGRVQIDRSKKFQFELGQWTEENGAFLELG